ncbi:O-antigen ligase family protein [Mycolicibacterium sp. SCSIO 43805]|uniref:O-antigen ligase family protein n=1 Tax=Mycolicibacterium sp. SCSIO 43805 TaxID=3378074 RepID=UPI003AB69234
MRPQLIDSADRQRPNSWFGPSATLATAAVFIVLGFSSRSVPVTALGAFLGTLGLFVAPRKILPAISLWLLVLLPVGFMDIPGIIGDFFTPAVIAAAVWMLRLAAAEKFSYLMRIPIRGWLIIVPFVALMLSSSITSERVDVTAVWVAVFIICVIAPAVLGQICLDNIWPIIRANLAAIGLFLGALAALDYLFHFNPWSSLYQVDLIGSSVFRTRTSVGHPLTTAMVASIALAACIFPSGRNRQWPYYVCGLAALLAVVLSVSRTSVIAVGASTLIGILATGRPRMHSAHGLLSGPASKITVLIIAIGFISAVSLSPLMQQRNAATEGISSATYRSQVIDTAMPLIAQRPLLGFGPGTSTRVYESYARAPLENSALQFAISTGLPASILLLAGLGIVVISALRRGRAGPAAGIVAFFISVAGFNILDASPAFLALMTPLIVCAVMPNYQLPMDPLRPPIQGGDINQLNRFSAL